ncbi:p-hydroxybenzoate hydroxylase [compost metagenome]
MTNLLHDFEGRNDAWDQKMQEADREYYLNSHAGLVSIAENYVGLPYENVE